MSYRFTPEEVQLIAEGIASFLRSSGCRVEEEEPIDIDAPYRTTLLGKRGLLNILIDVQEKPKFDQIFRQFVHWLERQRNYCELYIGTNEQANLSGAFLKELGQLGVGLILIDDNDQISFLAEPRNSALIIQPEPTLSYGPYRQQVKECVDHFNSPNSCLTPGNTRKDALRDMCEIVELLTEEVCLVAVRKGFLDKTEERITKMDWNNQINILAANDAYVSGKNPVISEALKNDLHSFRDARNLLDHKVRSKREEKNRQIQFAERMMMGPRLVANLVSIKSSISRRKKI